MNSCNFAGHVGNVQEVRYTSGGQAVLNFSVAVDQGKNKESGEKRDPLWVRVSLWGDQAESLAPYIIKGQPIAVSGQAGVRTYEANGETRAELTLSFARVTLLGGKPKATEKAQSAVSDEDIPI